VTICNSFSSKNHQLKVISDLKNGSNLPFNEVLPQAKIAQHMEISGSRERYFSPEVTLWAFLSQVMDDDQSQQAAVSRVIATAISKKKSHHRQILPLIAKHALDYQKTVCLN
jgi:hypothetical protein